MSEKEKNPHEESIRKELQKFYNELFKFVKNYEGLNFQNLDLKWNYTSNGCVWVDIERLVTWQFKDEIQKACEWEAEQKLKRTQILAKKANKNVAEQIELQNKLQDAGHLYIKWGCVLDYYRFTKGERKMAKKLSKLDHVEYYKPAYGNCFGAIGGPDAVMVSAYEGTNAEKLVIPIEYIDLERTFQFKES